MYRYAIYGDLYYYDDRRPEKIKKLEVEYPDEFEQEFTFVELFPAWQVEELSCINDFMRDMIARKINEMEENFYASLIDDPSSWALKGFDGADRWFDDQDYLIFSSSTKGWWESNAYLATLPLPDLRELLTAEGDEIVQVVKKYYGRITGEFLQEALSEMPRRARYKTPEFEEHNQAVARGVKARFQGDALNHANEAWIWANYYRPCEIYVEASADPYAGDYREGLRQFGYVFWDRDRLHQSGIFDQDK